MPLVIMAEFVPNRKLVKTTKAQRVTTLRLHKCFILWEHIPVIYSFVDIDLLPLLHVKPPR